MWIVTTTDDETVQAFEKNVKWFKTITNPPILRGWACEGIPDLNTPLQCRQVRNLIYLILLTAHRRIPKEVSGVLHVSLAGGRKTISADLQDAAFYFGCSNLIHIIEQTSQQQSHSTQKEEPKPETFLSPLPKEQVKRFIPVRIAGYPNLDTGIMEREFSSFTLPLPDPNQLLRVQTDTLLVDTIEGQTKQAFFFFEHLLVEQSTVMEDRRNFFYLFTLNPSIVRWMRTNSVRGNEIPGSPTYRFLHSLPKAELHCHLGGVLDTTETIHVAYLLRDSIGKFEKQFPFFQDLIRQVHKDVKTSNVTALRHHFEEFQRLKKANNGYANSLNTVPQYIQHAAFVLAFQDKPSLLEQVVYGPYKDPRNFTGIGIEEYERLGDLQGSGLLQTADTIGNAVHIAVQKAVRENIRYLEIRCSPWNYTKGEVKDGLQVYRIIAESLTEALKGVNTIRRDTSSYQPLRAGILLIASRHRRMSEVYKYIELMEEIYQKDVYANLLLGIDLAGNEKKTKPEQLREAFLSVMDRCQHITIHAGETEQAESIWGAIYHLHAERIGHGLTLREKSELLEKLIDREIALEMCPSSNHQIVGFLSREYPLQYYLSQGVRVTINTDNPGISRTNLTNEYLQAARLSPNGLTFLEIFQLVKNGFSAAFLPLKERERLLMEVEKELRTVSLPLIEEVRRG